MNYSLATKNLLKYIHSKLCFVYSYLTGRVIKILCAYWMQTGLNSWLFLKLLNLQTGIFSLRMRGTHKLSRLINQFMQLQMDFEMQILLRSDKDFHAASLCVFILQFFTTFRQFEAQKRPRGKIKTMLDSLRRLEPEKSFPIFLIRGFDIFTCMRNENPAFC